MTGNQDHDGHPDDDTTATRVDVGQPIGQPHATDKRRWPMIGEPSGA